MREVPLRQLGVSGLDMSVLCLGTMRFAQASLGRRQVTDLLLAAADRGINAVHSSVEYDGFDIYCDALHHAQRSRPDWQPVHVVKLAEPSFGEMAFDQARFDERLEAYRRSLDAPVIDVIQWMVRVDIADQPNRARVFERDRAHLAATIDRARTAGRIGALTCFPYHRDDVDSVIACSWCDGLAVYLNVKETDSLTALSKAARAAKGVIAIRPFGAGAALHDPVPAAERDPVSACLHFVLGHPAVTTAVLGVSSISHLDAAVRAVET